ncbi:MAG: hypothetical protein HKP58_20665 [Desulfatitalea sp.]|nr:hypothetical protein [Desulfatitalea sp.]NNK02832.1 hypothetical protein [Desulfatitalea sp.]
MNATGRCKWTGLAILTSLLLIALTGCTTLKSKQPTSPQPNTATKTSAPQTADQSKKPIYYDFGDIMLPQALKVNKNDSFIFHSLSMTAGLLVLSGNVEADSLFTFFENKMPVDGWQQVSSFKAAHSMMIFKKKSRWCVVNVEDGNFNTTVKIWVVPAIEHAGGGVPK